jgi:hypothetical protein
MKSEAEIRAYQKLREKQLDELYEIINKQECDSGGLLLYPDVWDQVDVTLGNIEAIKFVLGEA